MLQANVQVQIKQLQKLIAIKQEANQMIIKNDVQQKIDEFAQKRLSHLQAKTFPFEIIGHIEDFRRDLANNDIITDEFEEERELNAEMNDCLFVEPKEILKAENTLLAHFISKEHKTVYYTYDMGNMTQRKISYK